MKYEYQEGRFQINNYKLRALVVFRWTTICFNLFFGDLSYHISADRTGVFGVDWREILWY